MKALWIAAVVLAAAGIEAALRWADRRACAFAEVTDDA